MQLTPRYGGDPFITLDGPPAAIREPTLRQRRRLAAAVAAFTDEQLAHPSRCAGWSNRDVIAHLDSTNTFWSFSIAAGLRGEPTRFLASFDPVATPAELVAGSADVPTREVLDRFTASTAALDDLLASMDEAGWSTVAEAPPGHLSISAVAHHALWDSWIHERDILLPLGITPDEEADEISACLRYVAALSPALSLAGGSVERGALAIDATDPDISIVVEIGDQVVVRTGGTETGARLCGDAVELVEALSVRAPLAHQLPASAAWMLGGLATVFDSDRG